MELAISEFRLGEEPYFTGIVRDITERKRAEQEMRDAEERMRSVVNHVIDGIITINGHGIVATFNPAAERMFGYKGSEVIGQNVKMLMPEPYHGEHDGYIGNYLRTGLAKIIGIGREVVGRRKDGAVFPMELAISEYRLTTSRYFTGIVRDITERKRAEEELRDAAERMRSVVNHVVDGIITIDERGSVESYNPAAERIFGYAPSEVLGKNVKMLMPEPYHSEHDAYIGNYVRTGRARIIGTGREVVGKRKDDTTFPMELAVSEFHIGRRRFFTGIVRDITERRRLQDEVQRRLHDLAEADRQKNEFLAMLSHELRNPLAPISNALHLLKMQPSASDLTGVHGMMERQLQHLVRLVDDLLDVSRIVRGKIELRKSDIDLRDVAQRAAETAKPVLDANGHVLEVSLPERPICVVGDLVRLAQVLANLLTNAAKYTRTPSRIDLSVGREGNEAVVSVRDPGEGIPRELLPRIFDLFVQGHHPALARTQGGLGIGLTLVKRLVEMHDGNVSAQSGGVGQGSEVLIRLPALPDSGSVEDVRRAQQSAEVHRGPRRRVLVVDDNVDAADSIAKILKVYGHHVRCEHDGPTALATAREYRPEVIVLDIGLPGMDGYQVAQKLRSMQDLPQIRIVAVTGYGQDEDRIRSREAGFDEHLTKPVDPETLQTFVIAPA
jgi:PAS domain S-box-containing protein